jgi:hypothetical protein
MKELETQERTFQGDLLEVDSRPYRIVTRTHRLHLVNLRGSDLLLHLQEYTIGSLIERGTRQDVRREEIGSFLDEI